LTKKATLHPKEIRAAVKLAVEATQGILAISEAMHHAVSPVSGIKSNIGIEPKKGFASWIYSLIRGITGLVGGGLDHAFDVLEKQMDEQPSSSAEKDAFLSILNGVLGDYLAANHPALAIPMRFRRNGEKLHDAEVFSNPNKPQAKTVILIHGLCMNDRQWNRNGHDHGSAIERYFGWNPVYMHYNTGRHVSENGKDLAKELHQRWEKSPQKQPFVFVTHSMGGLVARSACFYAQKMGFPWVEYVEKMVFLGTPHQGAPLERLGNTFENILNLHSYTAPFQALGKIRSAGITDLRHGNITDEDWNTADRFEPLGDTRQPVPLPTHIQCYTLAAALQSSTDSPFSAFSTDELVPVKSALGISENPKHHLNFVPEHQRTIYNCSHLGLLNHTDVFDQIKIWLEE
jgi:pimeloyl-ACP methyl ester carboxylesterase